jgi:hypothetical protein
VEAQDVFTILLLDASYCVDRQSAQRVAAAACAREKTVEIDARAPGGSAVTRIPIPLSKLVRIISHQSLGNDRFQSWPEHRHERVTVERYRPRTSL